MKDWFLLSSISARFATTLIIFIAGALLLTPIFAFLSKYFGDLAIFTLLPVPTMAVLFVATLIILLFQAFKISGLILGFAEQHFPPRVRASLAFAIQILPAVLVLGSILLTSIDQPNHKANDASIKANLSGVRAQAELYYDQLNTYEGVCDDPLISDAINSAKSSAGLGSKVVGGDTISSTPKQPVCHDTNTGYAVQVPLKTNNKKAFCVDNSGRGTTTPYQLTSTGVEDGGETNCLTP